MLKHTLKSLKTNLLPFLFLISLSCSEGEPGPDGPAGVDGQNGFNALVVVNDEAPGDNCATGGVKISVGQDTNENGTLDSDEIASVSFVCNGADGNEGANGSNLVARTSPEEPGENCENGGTLVEIGADANGNGSLDNGEVQTSFFVCNGQDGADGGSGGENGLTSLIRATPSETCENGGITIEIGLDLDNSGSLERGEVDATYDICNGVDGAAGTNGSNGLSALSNVITEEPGDNCPNGGLRVQLGVDSNSNGTLDAGEIVSDNYICNGSDGSDGISSITKASIEEAGDNCINGGLRIEIGMDDVTIDGILQNEEVDYTYFVCNGADGADGNNGLNSLMSTSTEDPGSNCDNGGIRVDIGLDNDRSGSLSAGEIMNTFYVCNGANGTNGTDGADGRNLIVTQNTDVSCPNGGVEFTFGYDDNSDGSVDEILETALICNGENGADGTNGLNSIVNTTLEPAGPNCGNGGSFIEVGIDDNRNNQLDAAEVDASFYVCNGLDGSDGSNGLNSLISVATFSGSQGGCTNGGLVIRSGVDDDGDNFLDAGEVDVTQYVCNGSDGSDGSSDGIFEFYFQEGLDGYSGVRDASINNKDGTETGQVISVDRATNDSHGLIYFPELETLSDLVGTDQYTIVEAILYLRGLSGRIDGQTNGNWIGVKTLIPEAPLFEEAAVTWNRANSADENWSLGGVTSRDQDGDAANGYSDMFQLPPTGNFPFDGYIPLQISKTVVSTWTDKATGKDDNKGLVLIMADEGVPYELDIFSSNYDKDANYRPLLYLKVKLSTKGRVSEESESEYRSRWSSYTYQEKLAPLRNRD